MSQKLPQIPWKFLSDKAISAQDSDKFGVHSAYAKVLFEITRSCETPFCIALYSGWGTGKSSICNLLQQISAQSKDLYYVYLDVWKYSNDPLKRWILLETAQSLSKQNAIKEYTLENRSLQSHLEYEESWEDRDELVVNFSALRWLVGAVIVAVIIFVASLVYSPPNSRMWANISAFFGVLAAGGIIGLFFESVLKELFKSLSGLIFQRSVRHISAKPAFSSEKFSELFRDIVQKATSTKDDGAKRILFVFDNLDRCTEEVAVEAISVIKTYLDVPGCVYLVPCDEVALVNHIASSYSPDSVASSPRKYAKEFLNKFFQATLRLPLTSEFDIESYLDDQLRISGMTDLPVEARDVLVLGYLGRTPRQIKRVLNDLIAYRALAQEAEAEGLVEPDALTSNLALLTKMSLISVEWPEFLDSISRDPELWAEINQRAVSGEGDEKGNFDADLISFISSTRHVSPGSDVRPFLYLKRIKYEQNLSLASNVQNCLRKGDSPEFLKLLGIEHPDPHRDEVTRIASDLVYGWLHANPPRHGFLKNAAAVLLKANRAVPKIRTLELLCADLLRYISAACNSPELADLVDLEDFFGFVPVSAVWQKETLLRRFVGIYQPNVSINADYLRQWTALLKSEQDISPQIRSTLRSDIEARNRTSEPEAMPLLLEACRILPNSEWLPSEPTLNDIAARVQFSGEPIDRNRIQVLLCYQKRIGEAGCSVLASTLAGTLHGSRSRSLDNLATEAIAFLKSFRASRWSEQNAGIVVSVLVEQVNAHGSWSEKAQWISPLIHMRQGVPSSQRAAIDSLYKPLFADAGDPSGMAQFLTGLTPPVATQLLATKDNVQALHDLPSRFENRFPPQARSYREQILNCFPAISLLSHLGIFDEARTWDLELIPEIAKRAKQEKVSDEVLQPRIKDVVEKFLVGRAEQQPNLLDGILLLARSNPGVLSEETAVSLSSCCLTRLAANIEKYYADIRFLVSHSPGNAFRIVVDHLIEKFFIPRDPHWIEVLLRVSEDLKNYPGTAGDERLLESLNDFAFEAARANPSEASIIFENLREFVPTGLKQKNIDEALDRLLALEAAGAPASQLQPYFDLLKPEVATLPEGAKQKLEKVVGRMLGPAKSEDVKLAVLSFLGSSETFHFSDEVRERILELTTSQGAVGDAALKLSAQRFGRETP